MIVREQPYEEDDEWRYGEYDYYPIYGEYFPQDDE